MSQDNFYSSTIADSDKAAFRQSLANIFCDF